MFEQGYFYCFCLFTRLHFILHKTYDYRQKEVVLIQQMFYNKFNKTFVVLKGGHSFESLWSERSV